MLIIIGLLILAVLLFGSSAVTGTIGAILGFIVAVLALSLFIFWVGPTIGAFFQQSAQAVMGWLDWAGFDPMAFLVLAFVGAIFMALITSNHDKK